MTIFRGSKDQNDDFSRARRTKSRRWSVATLLRRVPRDLTSSDGVLSARVRFPAGFPGAGETFSPDSDSLIALLRGRYGVEWAVISRM